MARVASAASSFFVNWHMSCNRACVKNFETGPTHMRHTCLPGIPGVCGDKFNCVICMNICAKSVASHAFQINRMSEYYSSTNNTFLDTLTGNAVMSNMLSTRNGNHFLAAKCSSGSLSDNVTQKATYNFLL